MAKKRTPLSLNIGTSSVLFIFVILCLVSFSVLSLTTALGDYKLSRRVTDNTIAYYDACNKAEDILSAADKSFHELYDTGISRSGYFEQVGHKKSFSVYVTDVQTLNIEITILYPQNPGDPFYEISSWKLETTGSLVYDDSLPVFK